MTMTADELIEKAEAAGAGWWVEEVLVRGRPAEGGRDGVVSGAHVMIGVDEPTFDGKLRRSVYGPFPMDAAPASAEMSRVAKALGVQRQRALDDANRKAADAEKAAREAEDARAEAATEAKDLKGQRDARDREIASLRGELADARAEAERFKSRAAEAEERLDQLLSDQPD